MELIDPIEYGKQLEKKIITDGNKRPYRSFRLEPFYGQIATGRSVGCNGRCGFCWVEPGRDEPENQYGKIKVYSPQEAYDELRKVSSNEYGQCIMTEYFRISGCEPTIGINHVLDMLEIMKAADQPPNGMLLETNGMILGSDEELVKAIAKFREKVLVRLSFKAGTPEGLEKRMRVQGKFIDLPFQALQYLEQNRIPHGIATATGDARLMPEQERKEFFKKLITASNNKPIPLLNIISEEVMDLFGLTRKRLSQAGLLDSAMVEGKRYVYEKIATSVVRVLYPEFFTDGEMPFPEYRALQKKIEKTPKEDVLKALDEAEFKQSEMQDKSNFGVEDDDTKM
ncbi:MAG: radical SAM protein [Candidatus Gracilibacteria bacterium]|jgi:uncharacterized Fe-S cluster-containing radical SAM superfamily protein